MVEPHVLSSDAVHFRHLVADFEQRIARREELKETPTILQRGRTPLGIFRRLPSLSSDTTSLRRLRRCNSERSLRDCFRRKGHLTLGPEPFCTPHGYRLPRRQVWCPDLDSDSLDGDLCVSAVALCSAAERMSMKRRHSIEGDEVMTMRQRVEEPRTAVTSGIT
ncbi:hypothetical protein FOZ63_013339 [Perkinsus olseni]|uniref:Uncharacterized protein n=1 Tax=Perkinsus olseni TaxID=32597 RepID=A0A7J6TFJ6_PEROL|nr:hypothetical protein FOZ63_013339 [Perkinsus olseni]KAF4743532.1 hypothetical protein FOZ62_006414 [Perkinsus olseni]